MTPRRWPLLIVGVAALAWLALSAAMIVVLRSPDAFPPRLVIAGGIALALAAPVAVIALVAIRLLDTRAARNERAALLADSAWLTDHRIDAAAALLAGVEARVSALVGQLDGITHAVAAHDKALANSSARLDAGSTALISAAAAANTASATLEQRLPAAAIQAEALRNLLATIDGALVGQLATTDTLLASLGARTNAIIDATAAVGGQIDAMTTAAAAASAALGEPIAAIESAGTAMLDRTVAAAEAARAGLASHAETLDATLAGARRDLDAIGAAAAASAGAEIATLQAAVASLNSEIALQADRYRLFIEQLERGFATLDTRLAASSAAGQAELDSIAAGMVAARNAINALAPPIDGTRSAVDSLLAQLGGVTRATGQAITALETALPSAAPQVAALATGLDALHTSAAALAAPVAAAGAAAAATRETLEAIETQAGSTALAAAAELVEAFNRVRDIAAQTAGTMRTTLAAVVTEAEAALDSAGSTRAETAFAGPVRAALAEITTANTRAADAAQAAAERVTQRMVALAGTVASVEARLSEAEDRHGGRLRADIATRSSSLLASMEAASIDITRMLAGTIDEAAWQKWLGGERGMFLRRAVRLIDAGTMREITRLWQGDNDFREAATRFIGEFEALIARVGPEREGRSLALALLSSDQGKLYIALAQATDRLQ